MTAPSAKTMRDAKLRIGVLGANGQLGQSLVRSVGASQDLELAFATTRRDFDLSDLEGVGSWLDAERSRVPDVVVNAAAYTKVDRCESEVEMANQINALAPAEWARQLSRRGVRFLHVSTDYVFSGDGKRPYREDDQADPKTVYGSSKRAGEISVFEADPKALIVRTGWLFGPGRNFVIAILDQAGKRCRGEIDGPLTVVDDQHGSPTSAADLAEALLELIRRGAAEDAGVSGLLHLRNAGETTWYAFARAILDQSGFEALEIDPVPTSAFETAAARPAYSVLSCERAAQIGITMRPWRESLNAYLASGDGVQGAVPDATCREALA